MNASSFNIPTKIIFGNVSLKKLSGEIPDSVKTILIITDKNLRQHTSVIQEVEDLLKAFSIHIFDDIAENPLIESVDEGAAFAVNHDIELILGIGGGSSMDAAKGIALASANEIAFNSILNGETPTKYSLPLICIPTTSGTGSEVTPFAVFTDKTDESKKGYSHPSLFPSVSIIDPELTYSMPENVRINTGLDVLSHASEAYLSLESNELNDQIALESIKLVIENLPLAVKGDQSAITSMAYASVLAGIAITHASTILPHIMGYPFTVFHQIPHGKASILTLPAFLDFLEESGIDEKVKVLRTIFESAGGLKNFLNDLNISPKLSDHGIKLSELDLFVEKTICKGDVKITPGNITEDKIRKIYLDSM